MIYTTYPENIPYEYLNNKAKKITIKDWENEWVANDLLSEGILEEAVIENWGRIQTCRWMFAENTNLKKVTLPKAWGEVEDISYMFKGCPSLEEITLPDDWCFIIEKVGMFEDCINLKYIHTNCYIDRDLLKIPSSTIIVNKSLETINEVFN